VQTQREDANCGEEGGVAISARGRGREIGDGNSSIRGNRDLVHQGRLHKSFKTSRKKRCCIKRAARKEKGSCGMVLWEGRTNLILMRKGGEGET